MAQRERFSRLYTESEVEEMQKTHAVLQQIKTKKDTINVEGSNLKFETVDLD